MRRRDKADVVTAACLQFKHHFGESFVRHFVLFLLSPGLGYLVVLTVNTPKIAVAEKDVSGAVRSGKTRFLAKMRGVARDYRQTSRIARSYLVVEAIVAAIFRADGACGEQIFKLVDAVYQLILRQEF